MTREADERPVAVDVFLFLLTKTPPRLNTAGICRSDKHVDSGTGSLPPAAGHMLMQAQRRRDTSVPGGARCGRPIWGDGTVDGVRRDLCSACWHEYNAFHGPYQTMRANPAAAAIDDTGLARLFVTRGMDAPALPAPDDAVLWRELDSYVDPEAWGDLAA